MNPIAKPFLSPAGFEIEGLRFREISVGDVEFANAIGVTLLGKSAEASENETEPSAPLPTQIIRLLWMLYLPEGADKDAAIDAALTALDDGTWKKKARKFGFRLSVDALTKMTAKLNGEAEQIEAATAKVAEAESEGKEDKKKVLSQVASPPSSGPSPVAG